MVKRRSLAHEQQMARRTPSQGALLHEGLDVGLHPRRECELRSELFDLLLVRNDRLCLGQQLLLLMRGGLPIGLELRLGPAANGLDLQHVSACTFLT